MTSGVVIGILAARTVSGLIADLLGWRAVYFISAGLIGLFGMAGWGAVSALGAGLSALALLVWAADQLRPASRPDKPSSSKGVTRDHALP